MRVLDLFCGTKSIAKAFEARGHEVVTIDFNPEFNPDICADVLSLQTMAIQFKGPFDVVWASPPCTTFSVASMGHHWTGGRGAYIPKTEEAKIGLALMNRTKDIINILNPKIWFIENPRGVMRKLIGDLPRHTVTYCQYGDTRMKPTDLWTNCKTWTPRPMCKNGSPCHEAAPRGAKTGTQGLKGAKERGVIPPALCEEIVIACEKTLDKGSAV